MGLDITFCNPLRGCDKKEDCFRWMQNLVNRIDADNLYKMRVSVSDFSCDDKGDKVKDCEYYIENSPNQTTEKKP